MLRRTLLCAVLACPLAAGRLPWALALQAVWSLGSAQLCPESTWYAPVRKKTLRRRVLFSVCAACACTAAAYKLCAALFSPAAAPLYQALSFVTGALLQAFLLLRVQKAGRRHLLACLPLLAIFIAYTR